MQTKCKRRSAREVAADQCSADYLPVSNVTGKKSAELRRNLNFEFENLKNNKSEENSFRNICKNWTSCPQFRYHSAEQILSE
jgi:hypothetical protein